MSEMRSKPFPWKCAQCGKKAVYPEVVPYTVEMEHDGRSYELTIPDLVTPRCRECQEIVLDDAANRRISNALRQHAGLLTPEQIRGNREALKKTQRELAALLGIAEATLSRWETGSQIQQRAMDRLLRIVFAFSDVRSTLSDEDKLSKLGLLKPNIESDFLGAHQELREAIRAVLTSATDSSGSASHLRDFTTAWKGLEPEVIDSVSLAFLWCASADSKSLSF